MPGRATTAQNRSFVSNPSAFHVLICLILLNCSSFSTRTRFGILSRYVYVSFDLILFPLVVFHVSFLYILVSFTLIQSQSIGL